MAIGIQNFPNIDTTDPTNFPNGRIKDDPAGVVGTPVKEETWGDMAIFFDKLMRMAGQTANNTPDNETNGYQYITALRSVIDPPFITSGMTLGTSPAVSNNGSPNYNAAFKIGFNEVSMCGVLKFTASGAASITILTLPSQARPASAVVITTLVDLSGSKLP